MARAEMAAISPCLIVSDVEETIAFYCGKMGFETRFLEPKEGPFFAIIGRQGVQIFIKADRNVKPLPNHTRHHFMRWDAFVYVADPDALATEFGAQGAAFSRPLEDTEDGLRGFEIEDPNGYVLFFGRPR